MFRSDLDFLPLVEDVQNAMSAVLNLVNINIKITGAYNTNYIYT